MAISLIRNALARQRWILLVSILLLLAFAATLFGIADISQVGTTWSSKIEPIISLATFLVALLVWMADAVNGWRDSLPCKLTAAFAYDGREVMRCERADLASEADSRAMGQQLGRQMSDGNDLSIALPAFEVSGGAPEEGDDGTIYRHYRIDFRLLKLPERVKDLAENETLVWAPPFDEPKVVSETGT
jgi:hypothetical protein